MNNTTQTSPGSPPAGSGTLMFVDAIRTQRQRASTILLALSVVFLGFTIWLAVKSFSAPEAKPEAKPAETNPLNPEEPPPPTPEVINPKKGDYTVGWLGLLFGFLVTGSVGAWLATFPPKPTVEGQRSDVRLAILAVGGLLGFALIAFGTWFFYRWSDSLLKAIEKVEWADLKWVVYPLLMIAGGAGLVMLAVQPARDEERNNPRIRRFVYGSNLGLTVMLLFIVLVVGNVVYGVQGKSRLDTTASGFFSLSETTQKFLANLEQPVTAYAILSESSSRIFDDIRKLLQSCEDASHGKFKVKYVSPQSNKTELAALRARYTQLELNDTGVLLVVGEEDRPGTSAGRYAFIRSSEFIERASQQNQAAFAGEARMLRELMFLVENRQKPVIYFTQSNGEVSVGQAPPGEHNPERSARRLKEFLEKNYLDVRPLTFDLVKPEVPTDADVVVVAAPRSPFATASLEALQRYMSQDRPGGKKGKLIVLAGNPSPRDARKPGPTGLEPLLRTFNVNLGSQYLFSRDEGKYHLEDVPTQFNPAAFSRDRNPIAMTLRRYPPAMFLPREVGIAPGNPENKALELLFTATDFVWSEPEFPDNPQKMLAELNKKQLYRYKSVGVVVSDSKGSPRLAVYGSGAIASDFWIEAVGTEAPREFDLISVTIDWLRERPPLPPGVETKTYSIYTLPPKIDPTRLQYLPLALAMLVVAGFGGGVWVMRRR